MGHDREVAAMLDEVLDTHQRRADRDQDAPERRGRRSWSAEAPALRRSAWLDRITDIN